MKLLTTTVSAIALTSLLAISSAANATNPSFGNPMAWAGTGCPAGSTSVVGVNSSVLSILFDKYDAGNDSASGRKRRASCSFAVPINVPKGFQVSILKADWLGYTDGRGILSRRYFFAGRPMGTMLRTPLRNGSFTIVDQGMYGTYSPCGAGKVNLRINSAIRPQGRNSYVAVDTLDLSNKVVFHLKWRACR